MEKGALGTYFLDEGVLPRISFHDPNTRQKVVDELQDCSQGCSQGGKVGARLGYGSGGDSATLAFASYPDLFHPNPNTAFIRPSIISE